MTTRCLSPAASAPDRRPHRPRGSRRSRPPTPPVAIRGGPRARCRGAAGRPPCATLASPPPRCQWPRGRLCRARGCWQPTGPSERRRERSCAGTGPHGNSASPGRRVCGSAGSAQAPAPAGRAPQPTPPRARRREPGAEPLRRTRCLPAPARGVSFGGTKPASPWLPPASRCADASGCERPDRAAPAFVARNRRQGSSCNGGEKPPSELRRLGGRPRVRRR
mmetsp:Transcript_16169/g.41124  ORF Transcript_16169/g.41124 Transcript_16169/m.41124 type:complete len:221 (-) Transcript_16169:270-932(-)